MALSTRRLLDCHVSRDQVDEGAGAMVDREASDAGPPALSRDVLDVAAHVVLGDRGGQQSLALICLRAGMMHVRWETGGCGAGEAGVGEAGETVGLGCWRGGVCEAFVARWE